MGRPKINGGPCQVIVNGEVCGRASVCRLMCHTHYDYWKRDGTATPAHRKWGNTDPCRHVEEDGTNCGGRPESLGYCQKHYKRFVAYGDTYTVFRVETKVRENTYRKFDGVYFLMCDRFIKIGYAGDIRARRNSLQSGNPFEIRLIAIQPGSEDTEKELHEKFASHRFNFEWFHAVPEILSYIDKIKLEHEQPGRTASHRLNELNVVQSIAQDDSTVPDTK